MPLASLRFLRRFKTKRTTMTEKHRLVDIKQDSAFSDPLLEVLFDPAWYLEQYSNAVEVLEKQENMTPLGHYATLGIADDRAASPFFDAKWYLAAYPDVP